MPSNDPYLIVLPANYTVSPQKVDNPLDGGNFVKT